MCTLLYGIMLDKVMTEVEGREWGMTEKHKSRVYEDVGKAGMTERAGGEERKVGIIGSRTRSGK